MIKETIKKLLCSKPVSILEIRETFEEIFSGLSNEIQTSSFLTLLNFQKDDIDSIICAIETSCQALKRPYSVLNNDNLIENIAFESNNNFFDVSLIQDLISSSADLNISKYDFDCAYQNKSFDILRKMGVDIKKDINFSNVEFEKLNFNYFYLSNETPYFKYSEKVRLALPFDNIFNITKIMLNPLGAKNLFLGVNKKELVEKYANISLKLQKNNSIIICADNKYPFVSPNGDSYIAEAWKNKIFTYELNPTLLGFEEYDINEIICENNEQNAQDIIEIISNKKKGAKYILALINSGLSLYISKKADSIITGIELAQKLIEENKVLEKFEQIKKFYS